jgi:Tfp pilus assembly protein PilO
MGPRARLIVTVAIALIAVLAMWILLVTPERSKASSLLGQIAAEQAALATAQQQLTTAEQARNQYRADVRSNQALSVSVPTSDRLPQLISLINGLEVNHKVNYSTTSLGSAGGGLSPVGLSFSFAGSYVNLQEFLGAFDALTLTNGSSLLSNGRLVAVNSVSLAPSGSNVDASVNMTAYQDSP